MYVLCLPLLYIYDATSMENELHCLQCIDRVATVREKSGKFQSFSASGKSQGILLQVREFVICYKSQGKVRKFHLCCLSTHIFHHLANDIWTRTKSWIRFSLKNHLPNDFFQNFISFHVLHNVRHKISTIFKMLKMFSCADLFSRPLCWSIY